ncbi:MAG: dihydrolipoyl dehydrogenase, partial [Candidatus Aureabacteria bacterium]|nr:dihydrolipoyl dehydrogenase [Candidatus Auribacterota bacterium]
MKKQFDIAIIGAGPAGYTAAIKAAAQGKKTLVTDISREYVGGVCLNEGCIPTKALLHAGQLFSSPKHLEHLGFSCQIKTKNFDKLRYSISSVTARLREGIFFLFKKHGVSFLEGNTALEEKGVVSVLSPEGEKTIRCTDIIIATGSSPAGLENLPFNGKDIISSKEALQLNDIPKKLLIVGGGSIGIEFAEIYNDFGSEVTIVELESSLLPREDADIGKHIGLYLKKKGVNILTGSKVLKTQKTTNAFDVTLVTSSGEKTLSYNTILVAVGRKPASLPTSSEKLIQYKNSFIPSDSATKEYSNNIYAIGDVSPGPMLAHKAYLDAELAVSSILGKPGPVIDPIWIPRVTYSHAEAASIGLSEKEAKEKNLSYKIVKQFFKANGRAVSAGEETGFVKLIVDDKTHSLLGAHILGPQAGELIHVFLAASMSGINLRDISHLPFAHPTYSEIIKETVE